MKKLIKRFALVFVFILSIVLLSGCAKEDEYIRIAVYLTDEGMSNYATGFARQAINKESGENDFEILSKGDDGYYYKNDENKTIVYSLDELKPVQGHSFSDNSNYNDVKNYVLFTKNLDEVVERLYKNRQGIDAAFIPVSELNNLNLDMSKLSIVFIDTFNNESGEISGIWVATKNYINKAPKYFRKFIASLVKANIYASRNGFTDYDNLDSYKQEIAASNESSNDGFAQFVYGFLGKTYIDSANVNMTKFSKNNNGDVNRYIAVLDYILSTESDDYKVSKTSYKYKRLSNSEMLDCLNDKSETSKLNNLFNNYFKSNPLNTFDETFDLDEMLTQLTYFEACKFKYAE